MKPSPILILTFVYSTRSQSALFDAPFWLRLRQSQKKCSTAWQAPAPTRFARGATTLFFRLPRLAQKCAVKNVHILTALSIFLVPRLLLASACCAGGGPKSFLELAELQTYKLGISTSLRDVYGRFDPYGDLVTAEKNQSYNLSLGLAARLIQKLEGSITVPIVYQIKELGTSQQNSNTNVGDILVGLRHPLLRSLFRDEWYPSVAILSGIKFPTGSIDMLSSSGQFSPGTGNGNWEPYLGFWLSKEYGFAILAINISFTKRFTRTVDLRDGALSVVKEGDRIDVSEAATIPFSRRFSLTLGGSQAWEMSRSVNNKAIDDSSTRVVNGFIASTYFLSPYWSLTAGLDVSLPIAKVAVNQQATRTFALTTTYGFY